MLIYISQLNKHLIVSFFAQSCFMSRLVINTICNLRCISKFVHLLVLSELRTFNERENIYSNRLTLLTLSKTSSHGCQYIQQEIQAFQQSTKTKQTTTFLFVCITTVNCIIFGILTLGSMMAVKSSF